MDIIRFSDPGHPLHSEMATANKGHIGHRLSRIISRKSGVSSPCRGCLKEISRLNRMTPDEVLSEIDALTDRIVTRVSETGTRWYHMLAVKMAPGLVKSHIREWIVEAAEEGRRSLKPAQARLRPSVRAAPVKKPEKIRPVQQSFVQTSQVLQFVWFYVPGPDNGMELRLSMASVARHFTGIPKFVVIGDRPSWYDGHFIPLPRKTIREVENFDVLPFRDTQNKLVHAVSSPEVDQKFCWIMDDVYLLKPTSLEDLETPRIDPWYRAGTREWHRRIGDTFSALKGSGYTTHQYATHLPHVFEKPKLQQMFDEFDYPQRMLLFENLYGNMFRQDPIPYTGFLRRLLRLSAGSAAARRFLLDGIQENVLNYQATVWNKVMSDWLKGRLLREPSNETV